MVKMLPVLFAHDQSHPVAFGSAALSSVDRVNQSMFHWLSHGSVQVLPAGCLYP